MSKSAEDIMGEIRGIQSGIPFRTKFERDNFLYNEAEGPRLVLLLCQDIDQLFNHYETSCRSDWEKQAVINEMVIVQDKINNLLEDIGKDNLVEALEEAEPEYWAETLSRRAAVEALSNKMTSANMNDMLNLPLNVYENTIIKTQTYLNVVNKTTRGAERVANKKAEISPDQSSDDVNED
jgi:hypothetical protein